MEINETNQLITISFSVVGSFINIQFKQHINLVNLLIAYLSDYKFLVHSEKYKYSDWWPINSIDMALCTTEYRINSKKYNTFKGINECAKKFDVKIAQNVLNKWICENKHVDPLEHIQELVKLIEIEFENKKMEKVDLF